MEQAERKKAEALVFYGVSGDLAYKKIFPALFDLAKIDQHPKLVIGMARRGWQLSDLVERARKSIKEHGHYDEATFEKFAQTLRYVDGDYRKQETFELLYAALEGTEHVAHYLAIPPSMFQAVVEQLANCRLAKGARLIVEKPFGRDQQSAHELNATIHKVFPESSIFRIDHYLGKSAVQNLLAFRFSNTFFEPIWNRHYIDSVQITLGEAFGVEGRGRFYEEVGAIRDVIQNHVLQIVGYLAMEPPVGTYPEALRDEQVKVFRMIRPIAPTDIVRGQLSGYRNEEGVAEDSEVETFAALKLYLDSWRWDGVPFLIRAGKKMPKTAAEIYVKFKRPPLSGKVGGLTNSIRLRLSPEVQISLGTNMIDAVDADQIVQRPLEATSLEGYGRVNPYARLLGDALIGDQTLFTREDAVEVAWSVVDQVIKHPVPVIQYQAGTWGPEEAASLAADVGGWHDPT